LTGAIPGRRHLICGRKTRSWVPRTRVHPRLVSLKRETRYGTRNKKTGMDKLPKCELHLHGKKIDHAPDLVKRGSLNRVRIQKKGGLREPKKEKSLSNCLSLRGTQIGERLLSRGGAWGEDHLRIERTAANGK